MAKANEGMDGVRQVKTTFTTLYKGVELTYLVGEVVHADDPLLKKMPEHFAPLQFPHDPEVIEAGAPEPEPASEPEPEPEAAPEAAPKPLTTAALRVGGRGTLQAPEIRS